MLTFLSWNCNFNAYGYINVLSNMLYVKYKRTAEKREKVCWPKTEYSKDGRIQSKKNNLKNKGE